jgi:formylmethanofuran dehydrogenase subunit E
VLISKKKGKSKPFKISANKPTVLSLPTSTVNSNNANSNGNNNAVNAGGTVVNNSWMGVQLYLPWYVPVKPPEDKKATVPFDGRDGLDCKVCKEFYQYAEANQKDGTLICFKCRNGY